MSTTPTPIPIRSAVEAERLLLLAVTLPLEPETLVFFLDRGGNGGIITAVQGAPTPDAVLDITDTLCSGAAQVPQVATCVVASVRPNSGLIPGDIDRWFELSDIAELHGIRLLEWYVLGRRGFECPRELLGEPPRWRQ